jgi:hypothetical protein
MQTTAPGVAAGPVDLRGYHAMCTVRQTLVDGTVDSVAAPVWQGDTAVSGMSFACPAATPNWTSGASVAVNGYTCPTVNNGYFYKVTNAGSGTIGTTQPSWPVPTPGNPTPSTAADSNGVVWTLAGQINAIFVTMPASATQALPNPYGSSLTLLYYDVTVDDNAVPPDIFETEFGTITLTPRVGLTQP